MAKSYKEAQSYIAPLMIVVIMPAVAGLMPGVEFNARMALIPVLSTSLVCKEIVAGTYHWNYIAIIFAFNVRLRFCRVVCRRQPIQARGRLFRT